MAAALPACTPGGDDEEHVATAQHAVFSNGDFETGTDGAAPPSWTVQTFLNPGITVQVPQTRAGLNLAPGGDAITTIVNAANQPDPDLGAGESLRRCRYGAQCAVVNFHSNNTFGHGSNVNSLSQTMTIGVADVDPVDGQVHIRFTVAPVMQNPAHQASDQPYYFIQVTNTTTSTILYTDFNLSAEAGVPWKKKNAGLATEYDYVDWSLVDVSPGPALIALGNTVKLEVIASGCAPSGHFGEVYVDGVGSAIPGLFVSGTGPAQTNPGSLVTYNMSYKNGSTATETGIVIDFTTPPNTTFQALTPPASATCTTPAVGATGTIVCTMSVPVIAGGSGTFQVSVNLSGAATGQLINGTYDIHSNEETALIGSKIVTTIGCSLDSMCGTGKWCNRSGNQCTVTLDNGTSIPSDAPHTAPTLNGVCTAAAGTLVCRSTVCDTIDNKCGKLNGSGICTAVNQATICRSGICDADGSCGYATNHGPCTALNQGTVCRSGSCSKNLLCQPAGGCNLDNDCTDGLWCNETSHACTPKLTNGTAIPSDVPHASPPLTGMCLAAAATLVCQAGVCDTADNKCGYAVNGGPCTTLTAASVCRSASCSNNGSCQPAGGCNIDTDCIVPGQWCAEATHVCTAKLANGTTMPTDAPHSSPTLNGTCTVGAGSLVCQATVCDTIDSKCGKLNGSAGCTVVDQASICRSSACDADGSCGYATNHGPCSLLNQTTVCRSGTCSNNGLCQPAGGCNIDGDCVEGQWCNETSHSCSMKLTNGSALPADAPHAGPILAGTCTAPAAVLVCQSSVCDLADDKCGFNVNGGPCTAINAEVVCRSSSCSQNGRCKPATGCNVDLDCTGGNWCNESLHVCTAMLANGSAIPSDAPHTVPTLAGTCTVPAGLLVCQSSVCDVADDKCGYDIGHGVCTLANGAALCRSGACSADGNCRPAAGCNLDADCSAGNWCQETTRSCKAALANGAPLPSDAPHTIPILDGVCSLASAALVCQSAVCDAADDQCGLATGDGPCTIGNGPTICRSGACSANGLCQPADGCNVDADCGTGQWCNESSNACLPTLENGVALPSDAGHANPTLHGTCDEAAAVLVCSSGVCDTKDDECGLSSGTGPCTTATAATVCRSALCGTTGVTKSTCVDCLKDSQCSGITPTCNPTSGTCVECVSSAECSGKTPICNVDLSTCVRCDGDRGSKAAQPCATTSAPFCIASGAQSGACSKCTSDGDCQGHTGNVCDTNSGLCANGCRLDSDCSSSEFCNDSSTSCTPKLANGTPLPSDPARVSSCTAAIGSAVCLSGVCDPADDACGIAPGDGPCEDADHCRSTRCNSGTLQCAASCSNDVPCVAGEYCSEGSCSPQLAKDASCTSSDQCLSHDCYRNVCSVLVGSGAGLACATRRTGGSPDDSGVGWFGLLLGTAAYARRRRMRCA
ncbi:MAG: hypothetical protein WDO69_09075 [Pseudomonadota bacterium]